MKPYPQRPRYTGTCLGGPNDGLLATRDAPQWPIYESIPPVAHGDEDAIQSGLGLPSRLIGRYCMVAGFWNWIPEPRH